MLKLPSKVCETVGQMFSSPMKKRKIFPLQYNPSFLSVPHLSVFLAFRLFRSLRQYILAAEKKIVQFSGFFFVSGPGFGVCVNKTSAVAGD